MSNETLNNIAIAQTKRGIVVISNVLDIIII
jgi:hypothetical protein